MTRLRLTIAQSMTIVLCVGFGFAALRNANDFWSSATHTLAITMLSAALVYAIPRRAKGCMSWIGFAVFGLAYLLVDLLPPHAINKFQNAYAKPPLLLIE